jgi:hypothetical protein
MSNEAKTWRTLGQSESETLRLAFLEYAKSISLITEKVHGRTWLHALEIA